MVVAVDNSWKLPIGYFFIAHLNSEEKAQLVNMALKKLFDISVQTKSITCDGPSTNFSTFKSLGASFQPDNLGFSIPHPCDKSKQVAIIFDPCHMIKLVRNTLCDLGTIVDMHGNQIK
jgi:hypothetical protein